MTNLIKNGWSEETALMMSPEYRKAINIILGELDGTPFNWDKMKHEMPKPKGKKNPRAPRE